MRYGRSRSFKVIDTGTNRQPVCNFLSASNSNIGHIVYWLRDIATKVHKQPVLPNPLNAGARVITSELLCKIGLKNGVRGLTEGDIVRYAVLSTVLVKRLKNRWIHALNAPQGGGWPCESVHRWNPVTRDYLYAANIGPSSVTFTLSSGNNIKVHGVLRSLKVIQRYRNWYQSNARVRLPISG